MKGGIFATQLATPWVQDLIAIAKNDFGYKELPWRKRAWLAIPEAGIEGQTLTTIQIEDALIPLIGPVTYGPERAKMVKIGLADGIIERTGELHRTPEARRSFPTYRITGHHEMIGDVAVPVHTEDRT